MSKDESTVTEEMLISQLVYDNSFAKDVAQDVDNTNNLSRPKTRRKDESSLEVGSTESVQEKFERINDTIDEMEELSSMECLRAKLNTIDEQTESDLTSSSSETKIVEEAEKATTAIGCCNTDVIIQLSQETQAKPEVSSYGTQMLSSTLDSYTQTIKEEKKLCQENTSRVEIIKPELAKTKRLVVQILPSIDIGRTLTLQKVHHFSIDEHGKTQFHSPIRDNNVAYYEITADDVFDEKISVFNVKCRVKLMDSGKEDSEIPPSLINCFTAYSQPSSVSDCMLVKENEFKNAEETKDETTDMVPNKEMVYKSYQLYDNPNLHDPGELPTDLDVASIDTSVYKTFINPKGLPSSPAITDFEHKPTNTHSGFKGNLSFLTLKPKAVSKESPNQKPETPVLPKELNSKLWDIGLYCSKGVQCCNIAAAAIDEVKDQNEIKDKEETKENSAKMDTMSYEKISFSISYSTEETITSDSLDDRGNNEVKPLDRNENERELLTIEPSPEFKPENGESFSQVDVKRNSLVPTPTEEGSFKLNDATPSTASKSDKMSREKDELKIKIVNPPSIEQLQAEEKDDRRDQTDSSRASIRQERDKTSKSLSSMEAKSMNTNRSSSTDSTVHDFISGLTETKSDDLKKVKSRIRKSKDKKNSHDFTVLPVQVHGDYLPNDCYSISPHMQLGNNGRYKDEEGSFCGNNSSKHKDVHFRHRTFKYIPKYHLKKYTLDSSNSDTVTVGGTASEGEVNCRCSTSVGEIHKCKNIDPFDRKQLQLAYRKFSEDSKVSVRERRTYFNHWVTYYIKKNTPLVKNSSSSSSSNK